MKKLKIKMACILNTDDLAIWSVLCSDRSMLNTGLRVKLKIAFSVLSLIAIGLLFDYHFLYKPTEINSGIFTIDKVFVGHHSDVWAVKFSPDGKLIASGSVDSTVKIWNKDGELFQNFKHPQGVTSLAFSPDGNYVLSGSYDGIVRLWRLKDGALAKSFVGHQATVWSVAFSPDGNTIASCGEDRTIRLWNLSTGALIRTMTGHALNIWAIEFTPDGTKIVSGSFDKTIKIWNAARGELIRTIQGHSEAIVDIAVSPEGQIFASASDDKSIKIWNLEDGKLLHTLIGGDEHVQGLAFSRDGKRLISSGRDKPALGEFLQNFFGDSEYNKGVSMRLWDLTTNKMMQTFSHHANDVNDVDYSLDGKWIVSASSDQTVCLWRSSM